MKTQEYTFVGVLGLAMLAAFGQQLIFELLEVATPPLSVLIVNVVAGLVLWFIDAVWIGVKRGRGK